MLGIAVRVICEMGICAWFFYKSFWGVLPVMGPGIYRFCAGGKQLERKKKREFESQFQECILAVSTSLRAGYSLENAFLESLEDMERMFGTRSGIARELQGISRGLKNNRNLGQLLEGLGERRGSETVKEFADIVKIGVQSGGNLVEIISSTARLMDRERKLRQDIETSVSGKRMEGKIMSYIPFFMIFYVQMGNPGYFDFFYHNGTGVLIMTVCLVLYFLAVTVIDIILEIAG